MKSSPRPVLSISSVLSAAVTALRSILSCTREVFLSCVCKKAYLLQELQPDTKPGMFHVEDLAVSKLLMAPSKKTAEVKEPGWSQGANQSEMRHPWPQYNFSTQTTR